MGLPLLLHHSCALHLLRQRPLSFAFTPYMRSALLRVPIATKRVTATCRHNSSSSSSRSSNRMHLWNRKNLVAALPLAFFTPSTALSASSRNSSTMSSAACKADSPLVAVQQALVNSWPRTLSAEFDDNLVRSRKVERLPPTDDNRNKRPVYNGHYVLVEPTGIAKPRLALYSTSVAQDLHLTPEQVQSDDFLQWVSGNTVLGETWATPYALSIMGTRYTNNCPYGTGDGYGDGRAISIGELHGLELQLKGAGKTPFHRGADGRAVQRSSIREFLASEAMHALGVSTTRALSLVVSESDLINRPWYSDDATLQLPKMDDPRLADYTEAQKRQLLKQLRNEKADPNTMVREKAAITCRVATSFMRIGHLDLFARRVEKKSMQTAGATKSRYNTETNEWKELEDIIWHACYREFREEAYDPFFEERDIESAATVLLQKSAENISTMVADWIRVGFAQGNFNADNCLVGGRTMDYGPFGFLEEYNPVFAKWTGSGEHFGFLNQPSAGYANYGVLVQSVVPMICAAQGIEDPEETIKEIMDTAADMFQSKVDETFRVKMGFEADQDVGDSVWSNLEPRLRSCRTDWTVFFRQLTYVMKEFPDLKSKDYAGMLSLLEGDESIKAGSGAFYEQLSTDHKKQWLSWIKEWRSALAQSVTSDASYERMRTANPKFVLREWMLVEAYSEAAEGNEKPLQELYELILRPYDEGSEQESSRYYRRASDEVLAAGGTAFMS